MQTFIVTDNLRQAEFLRKGFRYEGLAAEVCLAQDVDTLQQQIPFFDGLFLLFQNERKLIECIRFCRLVKKNMPIFVLGERNTFDMRKLLHDFDIEFFAVRPFSFRKIVTEMRLAIFERKENGYTHNYVFRDVQLDIEKHQVKICNEEVYLRNKEFELLHFFMANIGKVLSRPTILENVWDRNANILTNTVDVHVSQLRRKIENRCGKKYIHTVPCNGYIFG